jgi:hypothetical protein
MDKKAISIKKTKHAENDVLLEDMLKQNGLILAALFV